MRRVLFTYLLFANSLAVAGVEPVSLSVGPRAGVEILSADDGWTIRTSGPNPHFLTSAIPPDTDPATHPILSFEYFATSPVPNLMIRVPFREGVEHLRVGIVPLAETWRPFSVDLRLAKERYAVGPGKSFALILGTAAGHQLRLRNLQLRAPSAAEAQTAMERDAERRRRQDAGEAWLAEMRRSYPGKISSIQVGLNRITLTSDAKDRVQERGESGTLESTSFDRFDGLRDRSTSAFRIINDRGIPMTGWAYANQWEGQRKLSEMKAAGIKGLGGIPLNLTAEHEIFTLGIRHATVNVVVNALLSPEARPGWTPWDFEGRRMYLNTGYLRSIDTTVTILSKKGVIVSAILLISNNRNPEGRPVQTMVHPDALPDGVFAMPDVETNEGSTLYRSVIAFITERYSREGGEYGRVSNWIMHNEVNQAGTWTNMGEQPLSRYVQAYLKSCRTVYQSARRFDPNARVFVSLTHHWTEQSSGPQTYPVRDLLELFAEAARAEGDFEWGIAYHPYPEPMGKPDAWNNTVTSDFDTRYITAKNIEVLPAFLAQERFLYQGKIRGILLSEQGVNAPSLSLEDQRLQAAGIVYTMEKVRRIPQIEAYHYHNYRDAPEAEGGLLLGLTNLAQGHKLAWDVYAAFETERESEVFEFAWPIIGVPGPDSIKVDPIR